MCVGELGGHVLDIGQKLGGNAERRILAADPLDVVGAALLDDLQPAPERRIEQAEAGGDDLAENGRALASAGDEDLQRRGLVERRERQFAERAIASRTGLPTSTVLAANLAFSRSTLS